MSNTTRLYGQPGQEILAYDSNEVLEAAYDDGQDRCVVIEWEALPGSSHLPSAEVIVEKLAELAHEPGIEDDGWDLALLHASQDPDVIAAAQALLDAVARHVAPFRWAGRELSRSTFVLVEGDRWEPVVAPAGQPGATRKVEGVASE